MATLFEKISTLVKGSAHDLVDKAIDMNSTSSLRQYVRDLEDALNKMQSEAAAQDGAYRTLNREITELQASIDTDKATATKLIQTGHQDLAQAKASTIIQKSKQLASKKEQLPQQKKVVDQLDAAVLSLKGRHDEIVLKLRDLERTQRDTAAKSQAAKSLEAAGRLANSGADISVDDIAARTRASNDAANASFDRAMGEVTTTPEQDPDHVAAVDDLMAELTANAGKPKAATS